MTDGFDIQLDPAQLALEGRELPRYIAIEGSIGVGKTTLARNLAHAFNYDTWLEPDADNPFLERFYQGTPGAALPTQLHFLFQRARQLQEQRQGDMFEPVRVADFLMEKDSLFAEVTLDADELRLYQQVYAQLTLDAPRPDLVIFLQAPVDTLLERIQARGGAEARHIEANYLHQLNDAYTRFFHYYDRAPLLIVNAAELDLARNPDHYQQLIDFMLPIKSGRHYFNPTPSV